MKSIFIIIFMFVLQCGPSKKDLDLQKKSLSLFGVLPEKMPGSENDTPSLVELGESLYNDTILSANDKQSCATCHSTETSGVDNNITSAGAFGKKGDRNSPTVFNAGYHFAQFWDGRASDLKEQAKGPILNPIEMAMPSEKAVIAKISKVDKYKNLFKKAYPTETNPITYDNIANAIASFERTLRTYDRFDMFMKGKLDALSEDEKRGLNLFISTNCISCHAGPLLGATSYQKMGMINSYSNTKDIGRAKVTKNESDKYYFKVPSLRNIANTAPYFHDGSSNTLEDAVEKMAFLQCGIGIEKRDVKSIVDFLGSLSDTKRGSKDK